MDSKRCCVSECDQYAFDDSVCYFCISWTCKNHLNDICPYCNLSRTNQKCFDTHCFEKAIIGRHSDKESGCCKNCFKWICKNHVVDVCQNCQVSRTNKCFFNKCGEQYNNNYDESRTCRFCDTWYCEKHVRDQCPNCELNLRDSQPCWYINNRNWDSTMALMCGKDSGDLQGAHCCGRWFCGYHKEEEKYCGKCGSELEYPD